MPSAQVFVQLAGPKVVAVIKDLTHYFELLGI